MDGGYTPKRDSLNGDIDNHYMIDQNGFQDEFDNEFYQEEPNTEILV